RRVTAGEAFGLEAAFGARRRHARALAQGTTTVLEIRAESLARAARRAGSGDAARLERAVRRQLTDELLRTIAFTRDLPESEPALLLDTVSRRPVAPGEV